MNEKIIDQYCKQVEKKLVCSRAHKKQLLAGLKQELLEKVSAEEVTLQKLIAQIGDADAVAEQLQATVGAAEREKVQKQRRRFPIFITLVVIVVLSAITVGYLIYWENHKIASSSTVIVYDNDQETVPFNDEDFSWGPVVSEEAPKEP